MTHDLPAIKGMANAALEAAQQWPIDGAINWADIACVEVLEWRNDRGEEGIEVLIEEADPGAVELQAFVREYLAERGVEVEVRTEW